MLVPIAIGGFVLSVAFDLIGFSRGTVDPWRLLALYTMCGGIVGALLAAVPGFIDLLSLPPPVRATAVRHMVINLSVVGLFIVNAWMRWGDPSGASRTPFILSLAGIGLLLVSGWLGGKMVFEGGVGVGDSR